MTDSPDQNDDFQTDDDQSFADMLEQSLGQTKKLAIGDRVDATVLQIGKDSIFLDVGQKGEGILSRSEVEDDEGNLTIEAGSSLKAYFISRKGGELRFALRMGAGQAGNEQLEQAFSAEIPVEGKIEKEIKGGFEVRLAGNTRAFCPFSQVSLRRVENADDLVGENLTFKITKYTENGRNIVVSRRVLLEEERAQQQVAFRDQIKVGDTVRGTVTSIRDFGAFLVVGPIEGLLPISEVSHSRVENLEEVLRPDQELEVVVKGLDWDNNRFSFSLKDALPDPWSAVGVTFKEGERYQGQVTRLAQFGAFVRLEEGLEGLLHISKLGQGKRINHPKEVVSQGQKLEVVLEKIDYEAKRLSLALVGTDQEEGSAETSYTDKPVSGGSGMGTFADLLASAGKKKGRR